MSKFKLWCTIILSIIVGYTCLLILGGIILLMFPTTSSHQPVDSLVEVQTTIVDTSEETTTEISSVEESSSIEQESSSSEIQETSTQQITSEEVTTTETFTYKGSDGTVFNSIEELQDWIIENDRSISSLEEVYAMTEEELIDKFEQRLILWAAEEYDDYGDEGFWDNPEDFITDYPIQINSITDFKDWYRNDEEEGDILEINSSYLDIEVMYVFDDQVTIRICNNDYYNFDSIGFYLDLSEDSPNILLYDNISYLRMKYSGLKSDNNGYPLFYCEEMILK